MGRQIYPGRTERSHCMYNEGPVNREIEEQKVVSYKLRKDIEDAKLHYRNRVETVQTT